MNKELINKCTFEEVLHRNQKVILCKFPYNVKLLKEFRNEFPSAKWSRSFQAWYVPNNTLYRNRLGLSLPEIGDNWLPKLYEHNKGEFIKFRNALTQKVFIICNIKNSLQIIKRAFTIL